MHEGGEDRRHASGVDIGDDIREPGAAPASPYVRDGIYSLLRFRMRRAEILRLRLAHRLLSLKDALQDDLDHGQGLAWCVTAFAAGIAIYFALPREPEIWATLPVAACVAAIAWRMSRGAKGARRILLAAFVLAGLAGADLRSAVVEAPRLEKSGVYSVVGRVVSVEARARGYRLLVQPRSISRLAPAALPALIRITATKPSIPPLPGAIIRFRARLSPPSGPVIPGGYGFDRAAYYQGIGASGFAFGALELTGVREDDWRSLGASAVFQARTALSARIREALPGRSGAIAAALVTGDRGGLDEETQETLRIAGLAHVLAISGMHMALVAGTVFFVIRALLALSTRLALQFPIRKWAACVALLVATAYLVLSGASVATQRAWIMTTIVFIAILAGRSAITMRSVALAALVLLALGPEALLEPGFQMSFAAVMALVAAYEAWSRRRRERGRAEQGGGGLRGAGLAGGIRFWIGGLLLTSVIAGLATAPIAVWHFHRAAPLGLLANMAAMPLVSFIVMPAAVAAVVAMPFGLDPPFLHLMGEGIDLMMVVSQHIANMTPGGGVVGTVPLAAVLACMTGLIWMVLVRSRWRMMGVLPVLLGTATMPFGSRPDILIEEHGQSVALAGADGRLTIAKGRGGSFAAEIWLRASGDPASVKERTGQPSEYRCDDEGCVLSGAPKSRPISIAVSRNRSSLAEDCERAALVVTSYPVARPCTAVIFDAKRLRRHGSVAIYVAESMPLAETNAFETKSFRDHGIASTPAIPSAAREKPFPASDAVATSAIKSKPRVGGARSPPDVNLTPETAPRMPRWIAAISYAREGRRRPWEGAPADPGLRRLLGTFWRQD